MGTKEPEIVLNKKYGPKKKKRLWEIQGVIHRNERVNTDVPILIRQ